MNERDQKYFRPITHHEYKRKIPFEKEDGSNWVRKCIYVEGYYPIDEIDLKGSFYKYADDKYFIEDRTSGKRSGFRSLLYFTIPSFIFLFYNEPIFGEYIAVTLLFFFLLFFHLYLLYCSFFYPSHIYIYNRLDGTVTMPRKYGMGSCTIPFNKVKYGTSMSRMGSVSLTMTLPIWEIPLRNIGGEPEIGVSHYVRFMDKNRPLPPGKVFDPYRERDYQRRKAEGFPPPLYESYITIEEYTPEQTEEANKGKRANLETFEREPDSIWYDPEIHLDWVEVHYTKDDNDISPLKNEVICYKFTDGRIVYCRTSATGYVFQPSIHENYEKLLMIGGQLKEKINRPITDKWEERQRNRY